MGSNRDTRVLSRSTGCDKPHTHIVPAGTKHSKRHPLAVVNAHANRVAADHHRWAKWSKARKAARKARRA